MKLNTVTYVVLIAICKIRPNDAAVTQEKESDSQKSKESSSPSITYSQWNIQSSKTSSLDRKKEFGRSRKDNSTKDDESNQEKSLRLKDTSLADRWSFILKDSEDDFSKILLEEQEQSKVKNEKEEVADGKPTSSSQKSPSTFIQTLKSAAWSILISTATVVAMSSASSLSSIVVGDLSASISGSSSPYQFLGLRSTLTVFFTTMTAAINRANVNISVHKIKTYIYKKLIPMGADTLHKMILLELWRCFWLQSFQYLRDIYASVWDANYYESLWETYAPGWLRRGVRSFFVKRVQSYLQLVIGCFFSKLTSGWDYTMVTDTAWLEINFNTKDSSDSLSSDEQVNSDGSEIVDVFVNDGIDSEVEVDTDDSVHDGSTNVEVDT